jgi:spermidine/putrescine transport system substrate-binding protein
MIMKSRLFTLLLSTILCAATIACTITLPTAPTATPPLAPELILYNWIDYMPQSVLDAFSAEYGVKVLYVTYDSQEEAVEQIRTGQVNFDVAVIENDLIPDLVSAGLIAELDPLHIPNIKNISANFRDLVYDPNNKHTIPYGWGTTGILVRTDLVTQPVTRWADLWNPRYTGKVVARAQPQELLSVALKALGCQLNTENPAELESALERLRQLKPAIERNDVLPDPALEKLLSGEAVLMVGWPGDLLIARRRNKAVSYVLPAEGTMMWGDNFVISARSPDRYTAELFLNFLLRPQIGSQIANATQYASANAAAQNLMDAAIINDPAIYPPGQDIRKAEWYMPLSSAGRDLYDQTWQRFVDGDK